MKERQSNLAKFRLTLVSEDHSAIAGGVPAVVDQLSRRISSKGIPTNLLFVRDEPMPIASGVTAQQILPATFAKSWGWSKQLRSALVSQTLFQSPPVFHLHGVWAAPQYIAAKVAADHGVPFVLSAHGMLEPWLWNRQGLQKRLKKQLYWHAMAYPALSKAATVHAITPMEAVNLRALFPDAEIEIIPNAVDSSDFPPLIERERKPLILFLGRVEPKKGVDLLLRAFARSSLRRKWQLQVVGPSWSSAYQKNLMQIVKEEGIHGQVLFSGPVFGEEKLELLRRAWVMAAPSYSEVVGLVNLEAAMLELPSITTLETGLWDWEEGGGVLVKTEIEDLTRALEMAAGWSTVERNRRGSSSRALVMCKYSWNAVLPQWLGLYARLADRHC